MPPPICNATCDHDNSTCYCVRRGDNVPALRVAQHKIGQEGSDLSTCCKLVKDSASSYKACRSSSEAYYLLALSYVFDGSTPATAWEIAGHSAQQTWDTYVPYSYFYNFYFLSRLSITHDVQQTSISNLPPSHGYHRHVCPPPPGMCRACESWR